MKILKNLYRSFFLSIIIFQTLILSCQKSNYNNNEKAKAVDFSLQSGENFQEQTSPKINKLYVAIASMISPKETFQYYENLLGYISDRIDLPIELKQRKTYQEINNLLQKNRLHFAFVCSGTFINAREKFPLEILAVPIVNGKTVYHAYIITHISSSIENFEDLKGKSFAFTDPLSNTGYLYPVYLIKKLNDTPQNFFSKSIYTYAHDYSIQAVARKIVDGASVHGLVFDYIKETYPEITEDIKIINVSEGFGIPPIVVSPNLEHSLKTRLFNIFSTMHEDSAGNKILKSLKIDRYIRGNTESYQSIRKMLYEVR